MTYDLPTGVTWVNRHGETGLVVPLGDIEALAQSLQQLIDDPTHRSELGEAAQQWAHATFDRKDMLDSIFAVFDSSEQWQPPNVPLQFDPAPHLLDR